MEQPEKKKRLDITGNGNSGIHKVRKSKIFSPFRTIGNVSDGIPHAIGTLGSSFYIVTSIGKSFQIYDFATLHLLFVSQKQTESKINCLTAHFHFVFAAYVNKIGIFKRGQLLDTVVCPSEDAVNKVMVFGDYLVASTLENKIHIYKKPKGSNLPTEFYTTLEVSGKNTEGEITGLIHPPTYLNKIVVSTFESIYIFNIRTGKLLYKSPKDMFSNKICCIEAAPVLDMIAVGTLGGIVNLFNIKKGKMLGNGISIGGHNNTSKITSISFRTDGSHHFVAGLSSGDMVFYDLETKTRIHVLKNAHKEAHGGVANAQFLNGQPIVVSNGGDNTLKEFVFDPSLSSSNASITSPPRHLRSRGGHSAPPVNILFSDENKSHFILSASRDKSLWSFSLRKDAQAQELSQRHSKNKNGTRQPGQVSSMKDKFTEICQISCSSARIGEWDNVLTAHKEESFARSWDLKNKRVGKHTYSSVDGGFIKSVCISHCGNFAIVGSSTGGVGSYNMQSGLLRKKYMLHKKAVTGIAIDGMNQNLVSSGLDGIIGFYDFTESKYLGKLQLEAPVTSMIYHKSSDLVACVLDNLTIVVIDVITRKVIRILYGHTNRITSIDFSPDSKWLVSTSLDGTLRTWDLPTGGCIDGIRLPSVATNVKFSPIGDFLATTHVTGNGIALWTNKAQFRHVATRHIEEHEFATSLLPNASGDGGASILDGALDEEIDVDTIETYKSPAQIDSSLVTLSLQPKEKYEILAHLDTIRERNKPIEGPKKPEKAPFFLQLSGSIVGDRAIESENEGKPLLSAPQIGDEFSDTKITSMKNTSLNFESEFTKLLNEGKNNYKDFLDYLISASPSTIDLEIRSLNVLPPYTEVKKFVNAMTVSLESNSNYEIVQACFSIFLKCHADVIHNCLDDALLQDLDKWSIANNISYDRVSEVLNYCSSVISFVSS